MDLTHLPIIDWNLGEKQVGSKIYAAEILLLLKERLPSDLADIRQAYQAHDYQKLLFFVHKLHGAIAYCGLPRLKIVIGLLETNLKNHIMDSLPSQLEQLDSEAELFFEEDFSRQPHHSEADKNG